MTEMVLVRPRTGIILDGIPAKGAEIPRELADEWLADRLVVRVEPPPKAAADVRPTSKGVVNARKRRRSK